MKRQQCLALLDNYRKARGTLCPPESDEVPFIERTIKFINENPDCFERTLLVGHITASGWLLNRAGTHALMMHHRKLDQWYQPGGHCDGDPDVCAVAIKEAQEESGIVDIVPVSTEIFDIDIHPIPATSKEPAHEHFDIRFLLQVSGDDTFVQNAESKELRWIPLVSRPGVQQERVPNTQRSIMRMFEKWQKLAARTR